MSAAYDFLRVNFAHPKDAQLFHDFFSQLQSHQIPEFFAYYKGKNAIDSLAQKFSTLLKDIWGYPEDSSHKDVGLDESPTNIGSLTG